MLDIAGRAKSHVIVLNEERQSSWTILRLSLAQKLDYWLQLCYPSNVRVAAEKMDIVMWKILEKTADSTIPRCQDVNQFDNVTIISVPGLADKSYQEWAIRQPIRLGGIGLRCESDLSLAACRTNYS